MSEIDFIIHTIDKYIHLYNTNWDDREIEFADGDFFVLEEFQLSQFYYAYIDLMSFNRTYMFLRFDIEGGSGLRYKLPWPHDRDTFLDLKKHFKEYSLSKVLIDEIFRTFISYSKCSKEYMSRKYSLI
jgi:hypothetical protein